MRRIFLLLSLIVCNFLVATTLNVIQFGANGKDQKDDTLAFQKCADQLAALGGGTMEIPLGIYYISHVKFFGQKYSNITFNGNGSTINQVIPKNRVSVENGKWFTFAERKGADGCFVFDAQVSYQTNNNLSIKNIIVKNLKFFSDVKKNKFDELLHQISAHGVSNFKVQNCQFIGFLGDGIAINASTDYKQFRNAYNEDIEIINCLFDGINRDNRQGISIYYSDRFLIDNCVFKNTTRPDMPGAIDIEPNDDLQIVRNGIIKNCSFENIGGLGAICFVLQQSLPQNDFSNRNFIVDNCKFTNVVTPLTVVGNDSFKNFNGPYIITFSNSMVQNTKSVASLISAYGIKFYNVKYQNITSNNLNVVSANGARNITFERCDFNKTENPNGLGFFGETSLINFISCTFENFKINAITINNPIGIANISNNKFISTSHKGGKPLVTDFFKKQQYIGEKVINNKSFGNFEELNLSPFKN